MNENLFARCGMHFNESLPNHGNESAKSRRWRSVVSISDLFSCVSARQRAGSVQASSTFHSKNVFESHFWNIYAKASRRSRNHWKVLPILRDSQTHYRYIMYLSQILGCAAVFHCISMTNVAGQDQLYDQGIWFSLILIGACTCQSCALTQEWLFLLWMILYCYSFNRWSRSVGAEWCIYSGIGPVWGSSCGELRANFKTRWNRRSDMGNGNQWPSTDWHRNCSKQRRH